MLLSLNFETVPVSFVINRFPPRDKTNKVACAPSEDSDQPGHPPSLIRVFAVPMKRAWVFSYPMSAQRRLWSDRADARADLNLRWAHRSFCWFCHEAAQFCLSSCPSQNNCKVKTCYKRIYLAILLIKTLYIPVVESVLQKQEKENFKLDGAVLKVRPYIPPPVDECKIFLAGVPDGVSRESLEMFVEVVTGLSPIAVDNGETPGTVMLTFDEPPGIISVIVDMMASDTEWYIVCLFPLEETYVVCTL